MLCTGRCELPAFDFDAASTRFVVFGVQCRVVDAFLRSDTQTELKCETADPWHIREVLSAVKDVECSLGARALMVTKTRLILVVACLRAHYLILYFDGSFGVHSRRDETDLALLQSALKRNHQTTATPAASAASASAPSSSSAFSPAPGHTLTHASASSAAVKRKADDSTQRQGSAKRKK
jgi:hypothetical protein